MKILIIGSQGQLGWELNRSLLSVGEVTPVDFPQIDLTDPGSIRSWLQDKKPDVIINAAAYTAVDQAESEIELANQVNAVGPAILAEESKKRNSLLIHFSTNFVFNGQKSEPYVESDLPAPINIYGSSKLAGERNIEDLGGKYFIFRTSWLYSTRRDCFVTKVLHWANTQKIINIVSDQFGSPTWSRTLAEATSQSLQTMLQEGDAWIEENAGIYHLGGNGMVNRFHWAEKILEFDPRPEERIYLELKKVNSASFDLPAKRPQNTALDCTKFQDTFDGFYSDWETSLERALAELK